MAPFLSDRPSYRASFLFIVVGLFFIVYPIIGILKNNLFLNFQVGAINTRLQGIDAISLGLGLALIGTSIVLLGIKNILEERQRDLNLYTRKEYPKLAKSLALCRTMGVAVFTLFCLIRILVTLLAWIFRQW
jgi:ABC-type uncharacterized transport system permease subunit